MIKSFSFMLRPPVLVAIQGDPYNPMIARTPLR
jgi:hypothetical protein